VLLSFFYFKSKEIQMKRIIRFASIFLLGLLCNTILHAQCPVGQTEISIEINAVSFGTEISWELVNTITGNVEASQPCGNYATGDVVLEGPFCLNNADSYAFIGYDTFGDDWNGGFFNLIITEDGSVNGCPPQDGCILLANGGQNLDVEPDVPSTNSCAAGTNEEFTVMLPAFGCPATIAGCNDPTALNFNPCVNTPDNATCIFPAEGDLCSDPVQICGTTALSVSNIAGTTDASDPTPTCVGSLENTVWFTFDSDASGTPIDITVTEGVCSGGFGLQIAIYSGIDCVGGGIEESCNSVGPIYLLSLATPAPNTTYYVYVDGVAGDECTFTVEGSGGIAECCGPEFTLAPTCQAGDEDNFYVDIDITDLGTDTEYTITGGANITATGTTTLGPFPNGTATITLSAANTDCEIIQLVDFDCSCDPLAVTASDDPPAVCPMDAGAFDISATLEEVIPGGFLGTYTVTTNTPGSCTATPDGAPTVLALGDDAGSGPITLPFTFDFYGVPYTSVCIGSNGYVTFACADETDLSEDPFPDPTDPNAMIALYWDDLDPGAGVDGTISYFDATIGGQTCFVVEYNGVPHFPGAGEPTITGQIIICPDGSVTINCIDCQEDAPGDTAGQGIENEDGTAAAFDPAYPAGAVMGSIMNCVTFTPDVALPSTCDFVGWATDLNDVEGSLVSTDMMASVTPSSTTTYYAVVDCNGILCTDDVTITLDPSLCPPPDEVPTVGEWGLIILGLMMSITAVVGIRQRRKEEVYI